MALFIAGFASCLWLTFKGKRSGIVFDENLLTDVSRHLGHGLNRAPIQFTTLSVHSYVLSLFSRNSITSALMDNLDIKTESNRCLIILGKQ
jgi:hypothetical protein